jgi:hypothetical protein
MSEQRLPIHPYAEIFPPMTFPDFDRLCGDIQQHVLQEDIVVYAGKVPDGRSRYLACLARGVTPRCRPYAGECGSPWDAGPQQEADAQPARLMLNPREPQKLLSNVD